MTIYYYRPRLSRTLNNDLSETVEQTATPPGFFTWGAQAHASDAAFSVPVIHDDLDSVGAGVEEA